jgi:hypothetical protein
MTSREINMKMMWTNIAIRKFFLLLFILNNAYAQDRDKLELSASVASPSVSLSKGLRISVRLKNIGSNSVFVYKDDCCISVFASTISGKEINKEFIEETMPPPPRRESFFLLKPGHFLEKEINEPLNNLGVHDPGNYRIHLYYTSKFGRSTDTFGIPVWSGYLESSFTVTVVE